MATTVSIEGRDLILELHGVDEILVFKRSLTVPLRHIISVSTEKVPWINFRQVRMIATSFPGVIKDGHYVSPEGWVFYEMHDPDKCVTITLDDERYKRLVFQVEDKEKVAKLIREVIADTEQLST